ncbi:uncharacterized protein LOC6564643 [Drosophila grimshawi]|nr:uncharacterized protein LOC6564643 [Drosophila grimshawi]
MDFLKFLMHSQQLTNWRSTGGPELMYIVLSHESCDLDSVASTLAIAYLHFRNRGIFKHKILPVLNMLRCDYASKTEVKFLLEKRSINAETHLVFRDDVPGDLLQCSRFILVNHHVSPFHYCSEEVYDYRPYQCEAARLPIYCQRIMHPMRSCAAIVTERYLSRIYNSSNVQCLFVFELLHAALLLQNNFFEYTLEQLSEMRDFHMLLYLEKQLGILDMPKRTILRDTLVRAMFNLDELTLPQILRREFKLMCAKNENYFVRIAHCCFPMAVTRFISYEFAEQALRELGAENKLNFIMLLGTSTQQKGGLGIKEIGIIPLDALRAVGDRRLFDHLIINLNAADQPLLSLEPYRGLDFMRGAFFIIDECNIKFYDILSLMQRIIYDFISKTI